MSANLRDLLAGESEDGWSDEEEEEEEDFGPRERESRKRPDYSSSAWGVRLANLESLRIAGRLVPSSREAKAFRSDFRVPYEFFLHFVDLVRTIFPTATRDVAGRQCVPLELKVGALDAGDRLEAAAVWPFRSPPCMYVGSVDVAKLGGQIFRRVCTLLCGSKRSFTPSAAASVRFPRAKA